MDTGTLVLLIVAALIVVPTILLWIDDRLISSVRRNEIENERRPRLRDEEYSALAALALGGSAAAKAAKAAKVQPDAAPCH